MLKVTILGEEYFNESSETLEYYGNIELDLEHSLVSVSKWESKFEKPFLDVKQKTEEEIRWYFYFMTLTPGVEFDIFFRMSQDNLNAITAYIESKATATTFGELPKTPGRGERITAELIYYWMVAYNIPFECQHWHLNRLFALIRICNIKNNPGKKMSKNEIAARNRELNEKRRAELGTKG